MKRLVLHHARRACAAAVLTFLAAPAFGWTLGHEPATKAALDVQPPWVAKLWSGTEKALVETYSRYPDFPGKFNDLDEYLFKYKGVPFREFPFESVTDNRARCHAAFVFYYGNIARKIRAGDMTAAGKFLGCFVNTMQNCGGPRYGLDGPYSLGGRDFPTGFPLLMQLYPPPPEKAHKPAPLVLDGSLGDQSGQTEPRIGGYKPRLLGTTPEEAAFHTYERYWDQLRSARGRVCNIVEAYYADDDERIRKNMSAMISESARITADILYTASCIAAARFKKEEVDRLKVVRLNDVTATSKPTYMPPARLYSHHPVIEDANLDMKRNLVPLTVLMEKQGKTVPVTFAHGFGTGCGSRCTMVWDIPAGVFGEFRVVPGMNALLKSGKKCRILVKLDNQTLYDSGPVSEKDVAREVVVDMSKGGRLELCAIRVGTGYAVNHLVWGNPVLIRKADLPKGE